MDYQTRNNCMIDILPAYQKANKYEKGRLLDGLQTVTKLGRKHIIKRLRAGKAAFQKAMHGPGRPRRFEDPNLELIIEYLWEYMGRINSKSMKSAFPLWLASIDHPLYNPKIERFLLSMSASTLERKLALIRKKNRLKGISTTTPVRNQMGLVPINDKLGQGASKPGICQIDTVSHCGGSASGGFLSTLTCTDVYSGWTENRAMPNKKAHNVRKALTHIFNTMPFDILAVNADSGSEFINSSVAGLMRSFRGKQITYTRSRPYKKNDNCYVEQKNYTSVREVVGYERLENFELIDMLNEIYEINQTLSNLYRPTFKLVSKQREGGKIHKKYDRPRSPAKRLLELENLLADRRAAINALYATYPNPFLLKDLKDKKLRAFQAALHTTQTATNSTPLGDHLQ